LYVPPSAALTQHLFFLAGVLTGIQRGLVEREVRYCVQHMVACPRRAEACVTCTHVWRTLLGHCSMWTDISVRADARVPYGRVWACLVDVLVASGIKDAEDGLVGAGG
jgi:hypothetical protein